MKKKVITVLLFSAMLFWGTLNSAAGSQIPGDINSDGKLDLADLVMALQISGRIDNADWTINPDADTNNDGKIGISEAIYLLQKIGGLRSFSGEMPLIITSADTTIYSVYGFNGIATPEVASLTYTLNNGASEPLEMTGNGFSGILTLTAGSNRICVQPTDVAGIAMGDFCTVVVYDPVMLTSIPASQTKSYTLSGMVMASSPAVTALSYSLNDSAYQSISLQNRGGGLSLFTVSSVMLQAGVNNICIKSVDATNTLINNTCFDVQWVPVGLTSAGKSASSRYAFTGTAVAEVASLSYRFNNGDSHAITIAGGAFSVPLTLRPGTNSICTTALDGAGTTISDFCYSVAYTPVVVTSPGYTTSASYTLTGTAAPEVTSLSYALNRSASQPVTISVGAFSLPLSLLAGINELCTTAAISADNTGTSCINVIYNTGLPSSFALIAGALHAGTISAETALLYKVYAAFNDARLPAQYKGDDSFIDYVEVLREAYAMAPSLSQAAKDILGAFFLPPIYQGSWYSAAAAGASLSPGIGSSGKTRPLDQACNPHWPLFDNPCPKSDDWTSVDGTHIRVWYTNKDAAADMPRAQKIVGLLEDAQDTWGKLTTYMARAPKSDDGFRYNGDDGRLDIILADTGTNNKGLTVRRPPGVIDDTTAAAPVYILINRTLPEDIMLFGVVHELMHAIQHNTETAQPKAAYLTLMESTAQWAGHVIFSELKPGDKNDQAYLDFYLGRTNEALTFSGDTRFGYGLYLFPLFLANTNATSGKIIRDIWDFTQTEDEIHAIDRALNKRKTDLKTTWPKFALMAWNQGPLETDAISFRNWDDVTKKPFVGNGLKPPGESVTDTDVTASGTPYVLEADIPPFATRYHHYSFNDPTVRSVAFLNGLNFKLVLEKVKTAEGATVAGDTAYVIEDWTLTRGAKVQAIVKKGGVWQRPEDWSLFPSKTFCREVKNERIEELVLIFTAGDTSAKPFSPQGEAPMLWATDVPCGPGIFGIGISCEDGDGGVKTLNGSGIAYEPVAFAAGGGSGGGKATASYSPLARGFRLKSGTMDWTYKKDSVNASGTAEDAAVAGSLGVHTMNFVYEGDMAAKAYKAYYASMSLSGLNYSFQQPCDCPGKTEPIDCTVSTSFRMKPPFDTEKKQYTRQVSGANIEAAGDGAAFSEKAETPASLSERKPLDGGCECMCPPPPSPEWTCSGTWSMTGVPEP